MSRSYFFSPQSAFMVCWVTALACSILQDPSDSRFGHWWVNIMLIVQFCTPLCYLRPFGKNILFITFVHPCVTYAPLAKISSSLLLYTLVLLTPLWQKYPIHYFCTPLCYAPLAKISSSLLLYILVLLTPLWQKYSLHYFCTPLCYLRPFGKNILFITFVHPCVTYAPLAKISSSLLLYTLVLLCTQSPWLRIILSIRETKFDTHENSIRKQHFW
jgi:hypothetical protein